MTEYDEVERYRKLLEDWKPGPTRPSRSARANLDSLSRPDNEGNRSSPAAPAMAPPPPAESGGVAPGAILRLNEQTLVIHLRHVPEKNYDLVLALQPNGALKTQGVALQGCHTEELGALAPQAFEKVQREMQWTRDLLVFHLYQLEDASKIPQAGSMAAMPAAETVCPTAGPASQPANGNGKQSAPAPSAPVGTNGAQNANGLRRGQRFQVKFGNKSWEAVYWGKDDEGQVVAHQTFQRWALMHLDLQRFKDSLVLIGEADPNLVSEIEQSLVS